MGKIIIADVGSVFVPTNITDSKLWHGDYGSQLLIKGIDLSTGTQVHFSLTEKTGSPIRMVGIREDDIFRVDIPDNILNESKKKSDYQIYAFVYSTDENSGWTVHEIIIPVAMRPEMDFQEPSPEQQGAFDLAVEQVKAYAELAEVSAESAESNAEYVKDAYENISYDREQIKKNTEDIEYLKEHGTGGGGGDGSYTLPQATSDTLGGVKADEKTDTDTVPARIGKDGKLYVQEYPTGNNIEVDETLTKKGAAADAEAVGNEFDSFGGTVEIVSGEQQPQKQRTVMTFNPKAKDIYLYEVQEIDQMFSEFGNGIEVTDGEPVKENTVLTFNPNAQKVKLYTAEEVSELLANTQTGSETWRTICDYELTEDIRTNSITADKDGKQLKLKKFMLYVKAIGAETNAQSSELRLQINYLGVIANIASACVAGETRYMKCYVEVRGQMLDGYKSNPITSTGQQASLNSLNINPDLIVDGCCVTRIQIDTNHTTSLYAAGTRITVIGVDA